MKKLVTFILTLILTLSLVACGADKEIEADYKNEVMFEEALNNGDEVTNKTVTFTVNEFVPDSALVITSKPESI